MAPCNATPVPWASAAISAKPFSDSARLRFTFFRLWLSEAEANSTIASTPASIAAAAPRALGTSAVRCASWRSRNAAITSAASRICGTARGETKDVTSNRRSPASSSAWTSAILRFVGTKTGSDCSPSRGPTSVITARSGKPATLFCIRTPFVGQQRCN